MSASSVFPKLNRRRFLAASAAAGALVGLQYGVGKYVTGLAGAQPTVEETPLPVDTVVRTVCSPNCTGACGAYHRLGEACPVGARQQALVREFGGDPSAAHPAPEFATREPEGGS